MKRDDKSLNDPKYIIYASNFWCTWAGRVARMEEGRSAFKILIGKPTGKRALGRPRRRWTLKR